MAVAEAFVPGGVRDGAASPESATRARSSRNATKVDSGAGSDILSGILIVMQYLRPGDRARLAPPSRLESPSLPPLHGGHLHRAPTRSATTSSAASSIGFRTWKHARRRLIVVSSGVVIGGTIGLVAGVVGGWVDTLLMRHHLDLFPWPCPVHCWPSPSAAALGPELPPCPVRRGRSCGRPFYARIMRWAKCAPWRHDLPSRRQRWPAPPWCATACAISCPASDPAIVVTASLDVGNLVVILAGLSFLGLGAPAPAPELGAMAARGLQFLLQQWWIPSCQASPSLLLALGANHVGRWTASPMPRERACEQPPQVHRCKRLAAMIVIVLLLTADHLLSAEDPAAGITSRCLCTRRQCASRGCHGQGIRHPRLQQAGSSTQYIHYVTGLLHGNLGHVPCARASPVSTDLATYLLATT